MPAWIPYTLLRLALFGGTLVLLLALGLHYLWAALAAAVVGFTLSYIFFPGLRNRVSTELADKRDRSRAEADERAAERGDDELAEDTLGDGETDTR